MGVSEESDVGVSERSSDRLSSAQATPPLTITQLVRLIADANSVIEKVSAKNFETEHRNTNFLHVM